MFEVCSYWHTEQDCENWELKGLSESEKRKGNPHSQQTKRDEFRII